ILCAWPPGLFVGQLGSVAGESTQLCLRVPMSSSAFDLLGHGWPRAVISRVEIPQRSGLMGFQQGPMVAKSLHDPKLPRRTLNADSRDQSLDSSRKPRI